MESLVLAVAGDLTAFGGTQKSVMSKLHAGKWVIQPLAAPAPPWHGGGAGGGKPHGPVDSPM